MLSYIMDNFESPPRSLVVGSLTSANRTIETWLDENNYHRMRDADGLEWHIESVMSTLPNTADRQRPFWELKLSPRTDVSGAELVASGVLQPDVDSRILGLIGDRRVPLAVRPIKFTGNSQEELRGFLIDEIPILRRKLQAESLRSMKRALVTKWLDQTSAFSQRV